MLKALPIATSNSITGKGIMTLGQERKKATSSNLTTLFKAEKDASPEKAASSHPAGKPKTLLNCNCTELKRSSLTVSHSVQLLLTSYREILVLKRPGDKSHTQSVLRRHSIDTEVIREHPILPNALLVEIPHTMLSYVYQLDKEKTLRSWLDKIANFKKEGMMVTDGALMRISDKKQKKSHTLPTRKLSRPQSLIDTPAKPVKKAQHASQERPPSASFISNSYRTHGPTSPVTQVRSLLKSKNSRKDMVFERINSNHNNKTSTISAPGNFVTADTSSERLMQDRNAELTSSLPPPSVASPVAKVSSSSEDSTVQIMRSDDNDKEESFEVVSLASDSGMISPCSSIYLSRNSSARSSDKSLGECGVFPRASISTSSCRNSSRSSSGEIPHGGTMSADSSREHLTLNLSEKKHRHLFRRASEQFTGLLKMQSMREKDSRKHIYVKKPSSSTSELDSLLFSERTLDDVIKNEVVYPRRKLTPTSPIATPTSPVASSRDLSPDPSPSHSQKSGTENPDEFVVSRFHHTQIRNRIWKRSPRLQRNLSVHEGESQSKEEDVVSVSGQYNRSVSESPTAATGRLLQSVEIIRRQSDTPKIHVQNGRISRGYPSSPSLPSTLPRSKKNKRNRLVSESGGGTTPNSPVPSSKLNTSKSPKILRIFHRRQSSNTLKILLDNSDISHGSVDSDTEQTPKKLHQYPAKDVAMEMTLVDSGLLRKIRPEELADGAWMKKELKEKMAPNVLKMVRSFNQLALLVPTEILSETTHQARAKVISSFIQIARQCYMLRNFNSLKAVLAGLQCTPVYRLSRTWKEVPSKRKKQFEQLCGLMSECDNWQCYRKEIHKLELTKTPFIPFLGLFLTQVIQNESYQQMRQQLNHKVKNSSELSKSYSPAPPTDLQHLKINSSLQKTRKRSSSLGDCSPVPTSSFDPSTPTAVTKATRSYSDDGILDSGSDCVFLDDVIIDTHEVETPRPCDSSNDDSRENLLHSNHTSSITPTHNRLYLGTPTSDHNPHPTIEINVSNSIGNRRPHSANARMTIDNHDEVDGGNSNDPKTNETRKEGLISMETKLDLKREEVEQEMEELNLEDISFGFKRRSLSFESLLESYKDDEGLQRILESSLAEVAQMSSSLQSLDDSLEDEDEVSEDDSSLVENTLSDCYSDLDLTNSLSCSLNTSHSIAEMVAGSFEDPLPEKDLAFTGTCEDPLPDNSAALGNGNVKTCPSQDATLPLKFTPQNHEMCSLSASGSFANVSPHLSSTPKRDEINDADEAKGSTKERKRSVVKRSKSHGSKNTLRRKSKQKSSNISQFSNSSKQKNGRSPSPTVSSTPADMLIQFQIASMGCVMGVETRGDLRNVLEESQTNSEKDNYKLSLEREQQND